MRYDSEQKRVELKSRGKIYPNGHRLKRWETPVSKMETAKSTLATELTQRLGRESESEKESEKERKRKKKNSRERVEK